MSGNLVKSLILIFSYTCLKSEAFSLKHDIAKVVKQVVLSGHRHEINGINLISNDKNGQNDRQINDFIDEILPEIGSRITIRWVNLTEQHTSDWKIRYFFNMLLIDSLEMFHAILPKIKSNHFDFGGYYLIIFEKASMNDLRNVFQRFWDLYIHNVNVIAKHSVNGSISIQTFIPFSEFGCNKTDPTTIATFFNGQFTPRTAVYFPGKFLDLHKCPIKVTTFESLAPSVLRQDFINGSYRLYGRDIDVVNALADEINFSPDIFYILQYGGWGILYPNGTATGSMGRAIRREADFVLGNLYLKLDRSKFMEFSYTYFLDQIVLIIPPGLPLTSFQKLIRPFEIMVWLFLGITICIGFSVIAILQFQSNQAKEIFFGKGITNPFLNVLIAMFGGSQHTLPKANFPRYLLMMFLLFCLVIRSLYTGSLFLFLQSNDHETEPQTIEEMGQLDYKFYIITSYQDLTEDSVPMRGKRVIVTPNELKLTINKTLDSHFGGGLMNTLSQVLYLNQLYHKEFLYKICKEYYSTIPVSVFFPKNSYLPSIFDAKLIEFEAAGLIKYWSSAHMDMKYLNFAQTITGPKKLNLQHLSGTVQMLIGGLMSSIILFAVEVFWFKIRRII